MWRRGLVIPGRTHLPAGERRGQGVAFVRCSVTPPMSLHQHEGALRQQSYHVSLRQNDRLSGNSRPTPAPTSLKTAPVRAPWVARPLPAAATLRQPVPLLRRSCRCLPRKSTIGTSARPAQTGPPAPTPSQSASTAPAVRGPGELGGAAPAPDAPPSRQSPPPVPHATADPARNPTAGK